MNRLTVEIFTDKIIKRDQANEIGIDIYARKGQQLHRKHIVNKMTAIAQYLTKAHKQK